MLRGLFILLFALLLANTGHAAEICIEKPIRFSFYEDSVRFSWLLPEVLEDEDSLSEEGVIRLYRQLSESDYRPLVNTLLAYREQHQLDDWFYYQLIRKTAEQISPKAKSYNRYTMVKWFLLARSHYDATLAISDNILLFYVRSDDNIYDIPSYTRNKLQYVCLNYHDYGNKIDFSNHTFNKVDVTVPGAERPFSYRVTRIPEFREADYAEKDIKFRYRNRNYDFKVKVNPELQNIFVNYPVVDYEAYFNIPVSTNTYNSFVPALKEAVKDMSQKKGVDYLMRFTRNAFTYETDQEAFGKEKRFSPEQTLLSDYSDCDDRAALFFYLVREVYNLPMIVLLYPTHVTIAVRFDKQRNKGIVYKNSRYEVCEPTPQEENLPVGKISQRLKHTPYQVAFEYHPSDK